MNTPSSSASREGGHRSYWRANLRVLSVLLSIWFLTAFVLSILMIDWLDQFSLAGFPLGFWMAQQGTILVFIALILVYMRWMNHLDRKHGVDEKPTRSEDFEI